MLNNVVSSSWSDRTIVVGLCWNHAVINNGMAVCMGFSTSPYQWHIYIIRGNLDFPGSQSEPHSLKRKIKKTKSRNIHFAKYDINPAKMIIFIVKCLHRELMPKNVQLSCMQALTTHTEYSSRKVVYGDFWGWKHSKNLQKPSSAG